MKTIKVVLATLTLSTMISSCSVQQFAVNTVAEPFENGGKLFGEKTKGQEFRKKGELFILGGNLVSSDTKTMAKNIDASSYTIETKRNWLSFGVNAISGGIIDYKVVKVIKRQK
jgi:hypothetical protein